MKALSYDRFGTLDVVRVADLPAPAVTKGHVLVAIHASSVNVIDNRVRSGMMGPLVSKTFPKIPGADIAGVVTEVGPGVTGLSVGDEVFGVVDPFKGGAFAEMASVPARQLAVKPRGLTFEAAAALPIAGIAALTAMRNLGNVGPASKVLVHGGSGAVGLYAIQIAKQRDAHVTAVAGTGGVAAMQAAGADVVIDYKTRDASTFDTVFDVILNASGALPYAKGRRFLTTRGRLIEPSPTIPVVIGANIANLVRGKKHLVLMAAPRTADLQSLGEMAVAGSLKTTIARVYPLEQAKQALADMERGGVVGKVVVSIV